MILETVRKKYEKLLVLKCCVAQALQHPLDARSPEETNHPQLPPHRVLNAYTLLLVAASNMLVPLNPHASAPPIAHRQSHLCLVP